MHQWPAQNESSEVPVNDVVVIRRLVLPDLGRTVRRTPANARGSTLTPLQRTRIEKAAADCGFELSPAPVDASLVLRSARFPESISVLALSDATFLLMADGGPLLSGFDGVADQVRIDGYDALYAALERAAATARTLPNRVAERFLAATATLPRSTEVERVTIQRVGQQLFREALLDYWRGRCPVTGLDVPELLRASHAKPWAACVDDNERLDVYNGLLLAPHVDALFDGGWVTFLPTGAMLLSDRLPDSAVGSLGLRAGSCLVGLVRQHLRYLEFHRAQVFRGHGVESK